MISYLMLGLSMSSCNPKIDHLVNKDTKYIIVGEVHGTNEVPDYFSSIIKDLLGSGKSINAMFELPSSLRKDISEYINSSQSRRDSDIFREKFIKSNPYSDGRSSEAIFRNMIALAKIAKTNPNLTISTFVPDNSAEEKAVYERQLAESIRSGKANRINLVLIGNLHAARISLFGDNGVIPAAGLLPNDQTLRILVTSNGGYAWNCNAEDSCGPDVNPGSANSCSAQKADESLRKWYDAKINLSITTTASSPVGSDNK